MQPILKSYKSGQTVFREGEPSKCLYLIQKGSISIRKSKGSAYVELAKVHTGEVIGEMSFFDRKPRSAAAIAHSDVELLEIPFEGLDKIWKQVPDYLKTIIGAVVERLRRANEVIRKNQRTVINENGKEEALTQHEADNLETTPDIQSLIASNKTSDSSNDNS